MTKVYFINPHSKKCAYCDSSLDKKFISGVITARNTSCEDRGYFCVTCFELYGVAGGKKFVFEKKTNKFLEKKTPPKISKLNKLFEKLDREKEKDNA